MNDSDFLNFWDAVVAALYFAGILGIGIHSARRPKSTENYFLGGHHLPSWAIGLSMLATSISSVTFIALPAAAFALDWRQLVPNLLNPVIAVLAIWLLVPFFRKNARATAFEYLERRFGIGAKNYSAFMFLAMQVLRLGSILYLVTLPLNMITGIDPFWIMLVVGGFTAVYTIIGGLEAVVWTDVVQAVVLYAGGVVCLVVMLQAIDGGWLSIIALAADDNKFGLGPMNWDMSERTFWVMVIFGITTWVNGFTADQNVVQRYLAAKSTAEARKATALCAIMSLPTWAFFFLIGTVLYVFYQTHSNAHVEGLEADAILPYFVISQLPPGVRGLVVAGILSAAMSSISSSLNSFSTVATMDFFKVYVIKGRADSYYALVARYLTALAAGLMFAAAIWLYYTPKESYQDLFMQIFSLAGGVVVGFFILGIFFPVVHRRAVWQAFTAALALNLYFLGVQLGWFENILPVQIHPYLVGSLANGVMIVLALVLSAWQPPRETTDLKGLTIFTPAQKDSDIVTRDTR
jgi:SSS family solute:Na+ symporter